jgi:hypothetical protein
VVYELQASAVTLMRLAGAVVHSFDQNECIEVASCSFEATKVDQLGAGAVAGVKCLFVINSIAAVYRANRAKTPRELIVSFPIETGRCSLLSC